MYLNDKHFSLVSTNEVKMICKPLEVLNVTFFNHVRFYDDGSVAVLTTDADWLKFCLDHERPREGNIMGLQSGIYLWSDILENEVICDAKEVFKICRVIQFIDKKSEFRDVFAFGNKYDTDATTSFYFNNLDLLQKFIFYFKKESEQLFKQAEKNRFNTPVIMKVPSLQAYLKKISRINDEKRIDFQAAISDKVLPLTKQQLNCLSYFVYGKTAKEIAKILHLSPRTIESHLNDVKNKLQCASKSELTHAYFTCLVQTKGHMNLDIP